MSGMEGTCSRCGAHYYGWALSYPRNQYCKCGSALEIRRDGILVPAGVLMVKAATATELMATRLLLNEDVDRIQN